MASDRDSHWIEIVDPEERGILPLDSFHIPRRLKRRVRQQPYDIRIDTAFAQTMEFCAETTPERDNTWISDGIINLYCGLHKEGHAHSVECWQGNSLVGGLYGVSIGGAFFGESMFSRQADASKIALIHLVAGLKIMDFTLLDAQFHNPHLEQFGIATIDRESFQDMLQTALTQRTQFASVGVPISGVEALHAITQTS